METAIAHNLRLVRESLPDSVRLVAVSKFHPEEELMEAYNQGQRVFGESHVQEMTRKHDALPEDIEWHFIGHLQTNKVKYLAPYVSLIHAVDSLKLLREINRQAERNNRVIDVLLQLHIAQEQTKFGFSTHECIEFLKEGEWRDMVNVRIRGLMMMASNVDDEQQIKEEFCLAAEFFESVRQTFFVNDEMFEIKSWGMSDDYLLAVNSGSNMVRIGTTIFGERVY
ncbi:MAG: YggS family pyridoxal phosphate-dependent enzyme [Prevotella sp.]|nr:YggS family pyridoxal phosphate-dependent enzyme [Prevotella sp.]